MLSLQIVVVIVVSAAAADNNNNNNNDDDDRDERKSKKRIFQKNKKTSGSQTLQQKSHLIKEINSWPVPTHEKTLWTLIKMNNIETPTYGPKEQEN